jgi:hypothetical protein
MARIRAEFALPPDFEINSFANWVPAHRGHNRNKGSAVPEWSPNEQAEVRKNLARAAKAAREVQSLRADEHSGRLLTKILVALTKRKLSLGELTRLVDALMLDPESRKLPPGAVFLGDGLMYRGDEIVAECLCKCERDACVGQERKVHCVFTSEQSEWVIGTGLFALCYDQMVECPRCGETHPRGYVGRAGSCAVPFADQVHQSD